MNSITTSPLQDLVLHRGIAVGSSRSTSIGVLVGMVEVVGHLRVELLGRLLRRATVTATSRSLLRNHLASSTLGSCVVLDVGRRLGLSLWLRHALAQRLRLWNEVCRCNDNLNLHGAVVDENAVQRGESLAGTIRVMESDMGNATAHTAWAIRQLNPLDLTNGLLEVFLS